MTIKHTPLPWVLVDETLLLETGCPANIQIALVKECRPVDKEFIALACNSHYELLEALDLIRSNLGEVKTEENDPNDKFIAACENIIEVTIAKARGTK